ncbi:glycosyltransferase family 39 protein [Leifsonia sp. A12D58]|uniref:glycosyltransferase family 39 protein n=1 Tax=Leifsonia sp. A12D58 TaxID=3397674 RepID=UPI0039E0260E
MTSILVPFETDVASVTAAHSKRKFRAAAFVIGLFAFIISAAWSWQPSYWGDEAASVLSAERSFPSLFGMLGNVDAVHGFYYVFLHIWIDEFGATEFATRLPSAIAIGIAASGVFVLARTVLPARVAVIAGLVFAILPRVTYMGAEARSTAFATAIAVWLTVLLVRVLRLDPGTRRSRWLWVAYGALLALGIYDFLYILLLLPVHAVVVYLSRSGWAGVRRWVAATFLGCVLAIPVLVFGLAQHDQISFIARRPQIGVLDAAVRQWFGSIPLAIAAWLLIGIAVYSVFFTGRAAQQRGARSALIVALVWMLVPSGILLIGTHLIAPMYSLRYLSICAPAAAIAIAIGLSALKSRWLRYGALAAVVVLALPNYVDQRGDFAKNDGSDWRQVADIMQASARPGDAIVFDESVLPSQRPRLAEHLYPAAFAGLTDVTLDRSYLDSSWLWDTTKPLADVTGRLSGANTVWVLQNIGSTENKSGADIRTLQESGFVTIDSTTVNRTIITEMTR